jgi:glycosyltransferase involved in cell wall biosynthesis
MLDIIIPAYNDSIGLKRSLSSLLYEPWITVTVINDASQEDYSWIK